VLLVVDARDRRAALRTRLAQPVVDEIDGLVVLALLAELERAREIDADRVGKPLQLLLAQIGRGLERRKPGPQQDLVRVGAADAGDGALVAQQRVKLPALPVQDDSSSSSASGPR
jgi:hypothetical protein